MQEARTFQVCLTTFAEPALQDDEDRMVQHRINANRCPCKSCIYRPVCKVECQQFKEYVAKG